MAGAGTKLFVQGEILTAAQTNVYLMDQAVTVFATAAARDAAFGGAGEPTLSEGRICYLESTNLIQFYDGAAWIDSSQFSVGDSTITSAKIVDGAIVNADINASAAIALSKLATGAAATIVLHDSAGVPTATAVSGDVTITNAGVVEIAAGKIVNADINASAAIALSKLATGAAATIVLHNSDGVPTATAVSGDVTITNAGVVEIAAGKIVNADINASAAITYSKLSLSNSITTTDLASGSARAGFTSTQNAQIGITYTLVLGDLAKLVELSNGASITLTIPTNATVAFAVGDRVDILQTDVGQVTIVGASGVTVNAYDTGLKLNGRWAVATLIKRATNTWVAVGNLTT